MVGVFSLVSVVSVQVWYVMIALTLLRDSIDTATEGETEGRMAARSMQQELHSWNLLLVITAPRGYRSSIRTIGRDSSSFKPPYSFRQRFNSSAL